MKKTILCVEEGPGDGGDRRFRVVRVRNTTAMAIGQILKVTDLDEIIRLGYEVVIDEPRKT